jgi:hypothetical protein
MTIAGLAAAADVIRALHRGSPNRLSRLASPSALLLLLVALPVSGTPRYAARYNQDCNLCHHSPTGGGKRAAYAAQYLIPMEMAAKPTPESSLERLDPQVSPAFSVGADLRTFFFYSSEKAQRLDFFQMQGDFYALFEPAQEFSIYLDQGQSQTRELYGMGYVLPANGYVRVGRFIPAYGWLFDDHSAFVREFLGFAPPGHTDVGVELGTHPGSAVINLGLMNGAPGLAQDLDHRLAGFARCGWRYRIRGAAISAGASFAYTESDLGVSRRFGPFGSANAGPITWVGEVDWKHDPGAASDQFATSHEVTIDLRQGVALRGVYDFYDPDIANKTGARFRYGAGIDALVYPFLNLQAMAVWYDVHGGPAVQGASKYFQPRLQVHFLY